MRTRSLLAVLLLVTAACSAPAGAGAGDGAAVPDPTPGPATGLPPGAAYLDVNARAAGCIGDASTRLAVVALASAADFHTALPGALGTPELDKVNAPLTVVVYRDGWPGPMTGVPGLRPEKPKAGSWDVCVVRPDGETIEGLPFIVYTGVNAAKSPIVAHE